jgi:hypothetical protein
VGKGPLLTSDAEYALDMSGTALRHWFRKEKVTTDASFGAGWTWLTWRDLCRLALIRRLADAGKSVAEANRLSDWLDTMAWPREYEDEPARIKATFSGHIVVVGRNKEGRNAVLFMMGRPPDQQFIQDSFQTTDVVVMIDLGQLFATAIDRAAQSRDLRLQEKEQLRKQRERFRKKRASQRAARKPKPVRKSGAEERPGG